MRYQQFSGKHPPSNHLACPFLLSTSCLSARMSSPLCGCVFLHSETKKKSCGAPDPRRSKRKEFKWGKAHKTYKYSSPKNEISVINYSPSCRSKPIRPLFIFGTQIKIFLMKSKSFLTYRQQRMTRSRSIKVTRTSTK